MKKLLKKRLELIFSLSLLAILGLPPIVMAQDTKSIEIQISNGDTTINGKDIKKLSPAERKDALEEIDKIGNITFKHTDKDGKRDIVIRRNMLRRRGGSADGPNTPHMFGNGDNASSPYTMDFYNDGDSARRNFRFRLRKLKGSDSTLAFRVDGDDVVFGDGPPIRMDRPMPGMRGDAPFRLRFDRQGGPGERFMGFERNNSQTFNYSNTDKDGIHTEISFRVTDAGKEGAKRLGDVEKLSLDVNDLNLSPEFSTGKTLISFGLDKKIPAEVKLSDSDGKALLTDKAIRGSFIKKVNLPRNGVYFLVVKQGGNVAVKRIVKE